MKSTLIDNLDNEEASLSKEEKSNDFDSAPIIETQIPSEKGHNNQNIELIETNIPPEENNNQDIQLIETNIPPEENNNQDIQKNIPLELNIKNEDNYKKENLLKYSYKKENKKNKQNQEDKEIKYQQKVVNLKEYNAIVIKPPTKSCLKFIKIFLFVFGFATAVDILMQIILKSRGNNFIYDDLLFIIFFSIQYYYKDRVYNTSKFYDIFFCVFFILNYLGIFLVLLYCEIRDINSQHDLYEEDYIYFFIPYSIKMLFIPFVFIYNCLKFCTSC